jgi:hypothetical protein
MMGRLAQQKIYMFITTVFLLFGTHLAYAQEKQVLSVTPPLFQISVNPGDIWQSSIKVVNGNSVPLTVYAEVVNFKAVGETGQGKFIPVQEGSADNATLAEWITVNNGPYVISPEQTEDVTFFVEVPENASPGGHYAAILISTEPPKNEGGMAVLTSQAVTSLLFMRVEGDMHEAGTIREFRALDAFLDIPDATFSLRFENKGNVHLQPRGDIVIYNMWGTERGTIPVNYQTHFGNVLPESIRDFTFTWKSDFKMTDIGRYKAVATLGYGEGEIKNVTSIAYFWVIPVKWTLIVLSVLGIFVYLIVFMVKAYVRRMLMLAGVDVSKREEPEKLTEKKVRTTYRTVSAPLRDGVLDLRTRLTTAEESIDVLTTIVRFVMSYKYFFISLALLIGMFVTITLYIGRATDQNQAYEVTIQKTESAPVTE